MTTAPSAGCSRRHLLAKASPSRPLLRRLKRWRRSTRPAPRRCSFSDIRMPGTSGLELLQTLKQRFPDLPVIVMTAYSDLESAVAAFQGGAFEYLPKPFDV